MKVHHSGFSVHTHANLPGFRTRAVFCLLVATALLATLCPFDASAESAPDARNRIVVISDLHLGVNDAFSETVTNKDAIAAFLSGLADSQDVSELVLNGDIIDEWFLPADYTMPSSLAAFYDSVEENNQAIFDAVNRLIAGGNVTVTYVPGNHDMLFSQAEVERLFPGILQARDAEGLGAYRNGGIVIEHGHRYNITCAPDPLSNTAVTGGNSILPSGYFLTRVAATSITEGFPASENALPDASPDGLDELQTAYYQYYLGWKALLTALPIRESFSDPFIRTGVDGYADPCAVLDFVPLQGEDGNFSSPLYGDILQNWAQRQAINHVAVPLSFSEAVIGASSLDFTDSQAQKQYFDVDASVQVVVFGHSHIATLKPLKNLNGEDVVYANCGSWIDHPTSGPSCTYVEIAPAAEGAPTTVTLYQYEKDGTSTLLGEASIGE